MFIGVLILLACELTKTPSAPIPNYSWSREKNQIPAGYACNCCRTKVHSLAGRPPLSSGVPAIQPTKKKRELD